MLKNIQNLRGAQVLSKRKLQTIDGGARAATCNNWVGACGPGYKCANTPNGPTCVPL